MKQLVFCFLFSVAIGVFAQTSRTQNSQKSTDDIHPFSEKRLWGLIDENGDTIVKPIYNELASVGEGRYKIKSKETQLYGLIDYIGQKVAPTIYYDIDYFYEGYCAVRNRDGCTFLNVNGNPLTAYVYDEVGYFSKMMGPVKKKGKWGFIDKQGKQLTEIIYDDYSKFSNEGMRAVSKNGKWGFIDSLGIERIPCMYDDPIHYNGGCLLFNEGMALVRKRGKFRYINKKNETVLSLEKDESPAFYGMFGGMFTEGTAMIRDNQYNIMLIDKQGNTVAKKNMYFQGKVINVEKGYSIIENSSKYIVLDKNLDDLVTYNLRDSIASYKDEGALRRLIDYFSSNVDKSWYQKSELQLRKQIDRGEDFNIIKHDDANDISHMDKMPSGEQDTIPSALYISKSEKRIALLIGNDDYDMEYGLNPLVSPQYDVSDMKTKLQNLGFDIYKSVINLDRDKMRAVIKDFCKKTKDYDVALLYYSGHAVQYEGNSLLLPVNERFEEESHFRNNSVNIEDVLGRMSGKDTEQTRIFIIDACRNEFNAGLKGESEISDISIPKRSKKRCYYAYATSLYERAEDGIIRDIRNSPYTYVLLKHIDTPNITIDAMFNRVDKEVYELTNRHQEPVQYNNLPALLKEFYFNKTTP